MNSSKKTNGWVLCPSKTFPGNFYYFNVLTGETAWGLGDAEKKIKNYGLQKVSVNHCHPEPIGPPTTTAKKDDSVYHHESVQNTVLSQPKFHQPVFGQLVFGQPKSALPGKPVSWSPIHIQIPEEENEQKLAPKDLLVQTFKKDNHSEPKVTGTFGQELNLVQGGSTFNQKVNVVQSGRPLDPRIRVPIGNEVEVQTCDRPLCQRFVNYEPPIITFNKDNKIEDKLSIDKIFTSTPNKSHSSFQSTSNLSFSEISEIHKVSEIKTKKNPIKRSMFIIEVPPKITHNTTEEKNAEKKPKISESKAAVAMVYNEKWIKNYGPYLEPIGKTNGAGEDVEPGGRKPNGLGNKDAFSMVTNENWMKNYGPNLESIGKTNGPGEDVEPVCGKPNSLGNKVAVPMDTNEKWMKNYDPKLKQIGKTNGPGEEMEPVRSKSIGLRNKVAFSMHTYQPGMKNYAPNLEQIRKINGAGEDVEPGGRKPNGLGNKDAFSMDTNENWMKNYGPNLEQIRKTNGAGEDVEPVVRKPNGLGNKDAFSMDTNEKWIKNYGPNLEQIGKTYEPPVEIEHVQSKSNGPGNKVSFCGKEGENGPRDLRTLLIAKRRTTNGGKTNNNSIMTHPMQVKPAVKKKVTFNMDLDTFSYDETEYEDEYLSFKTQHGPTIQYLSSGSAQRNQDQWYIVVDTETLLEEFAFLESFVLIDPKCKLLIPSKVVSEISSISIGDHRSRSRVMVARNVIRRLPSDHIILQLADDKTTSTNDGILKCCGSIIDQNIHVVLIANDTDLLKAAKLNSIQCYNMHQIKDGVSAIKFEFEAPKPMQFKEMIITIPNEARIAKNIPIYKQLDGDLNDKEKEIIKNLMQNSNENMILNEDPMVIRNLVNSSKVSDENSMNVDDETEIVAYNIDEKRSDMKRIVNQKHSQWSYTSKVDSQSNENRIVSEKSTEWGYYAPTDENQSNENMIVSNKSTEWGYNAPTDENQSNENKLANKKSTEWAYAPTENNKSDENRNVNDNSLERRYALSDVTETTIDEDMINLNLKDNEKSTESKYYAPTDENRSNENRIVNKKSTEWGYYAPTDENQSNENINFNNTELGYAPIDDPSNDNRIAKKKSTEWGYYASSDENQANESRIVSKKSTEWGYAPSDENPSKDYRITKKKRTEWGYYASSDENEANENRIDSKKSTEWAYAPSHENQLNEKSLERRYALSDVTELTIDEDMRNLNLKEKIYINRITKTPEKKTESKSKETVLSHYFQNETPKLKNDKTKSVSPYFQKKIPSLLDLRIEKPMALIQKDIEKKLQSRDKYIEKQQKIITNDTFMNSKNLSVFEQNLQKTKEFRVTDEKKPAVKRNVQKTNDFEKKELRLTEVANHPVLKNKLQKTNEYDTKELRLTEDKKQPVIKRNLQVTNEFDAKEFGGTGEKKQLVAKKNLQKTNEIKTKEFQISETINRPVTESKEVEVTEKTHLKNKGKLPVIGMDLKRFYVKNEVIENRLKDRMDEWVCSFKQALEETLRNVLENLPSYKEKWMARSLYEALHCMKNVYKDHKINTVVEHLCGFLYEKQDKIKHNLNPDEFMKTLGCGVHLIKYLKGKLQNPAEMIEGERYLLNILNRIEDPTTDVIEPLVHAQVVHTDKKQTPKQNFVKTRAEIISYLKKHYPDWKSYEENYLKIDRTNGRDLIPLKLDKLESKLSDEDTVIIKPRDDVEDKNRSGNDKVNGSKENVCDNKKNQVIVSAESDNTEHTKTKLKIRNDFDNADKFKSQKDFIVKIEKDCKTVSKIDKFKLDSKIMGVKITIPNDYIGNTKNTAFVEEESKIKVHNENQENYLKNNIKIIRNVHRIEEYEQRLNDYSDDDDYIDHDKNDSIKDGVHHSDITFCESKNDHFEKNKETSNDCSATAKNDRKNHNDSTNDSGFGNDSPKAYHIIKSFTTELSSSLGLIRQFIDGSVQEFREGKIRSDTKKMFRLKVFEANFLATKIIIKLKKILLNEKKNGMTGQNEAVSGNHVSHYKQVVTTCLEQALLLHKTLNVMISVTDGEDISERSSHYSMSINMS